MKKLFARVITLNHYYRSSDKEYRQICFNNAVLMLMAFIFSLFSVINTQVVYLPVVALVDFVGLVLALGLYLFFYKTKNYKVTSYGTVILLMLILLAYLTAKGHSDYALIWTASLPLLAYFLLGWRKGMAISVFFYGVIFLSAYLQIPSWRSPGFDLNTGLNVVLASVSLMIAVTYYEFTRQSAYADLEASQQALEILHVTDQLTQVSNRIALDRYFGEQIGLVTSGLSLQGNLGILLMDVDLFKHVNDTYGHMTGDHVLSEIARILASSCRKNDLIGRWGGEEFLVICPNTDAEESKEMAERMRKLVEGHRFGDMSFTITISIGVTTYRSGDTVESMMKRADVALYQAKSKGRNQWVYHA